MKRRSALLAATIIALLFATVGILSCRDSTPCMDNVRDAENAYRLIHDGNMPLHGSVGGCFALNPPGIAFGYVLGFLVAPHDPGLAERIGAAAMFFGTLIGLCFWLERRAGFLATLLAMAIFAIGSDGVFFATSLWPRSNPFFFVWMLYALTRWIESNDGRYLAAALFFYAAGLYWFMEMAPAIFVIPVLYLAYKPAINLRWLGIAAVASVVVWSPYLAFEAGRNFSDVKSLATQKAPSNLPDVASIYGRGNKPIDASESERFRNGASITSGETDIGVDRWFETPEWGTVWFQTGERWLLGEPGYVFYSGKLGGWTFQSATSGRIVLQGRKGWEKGAHTVPFPTMRKFMGTETSQIVAYRAVHFSPFANFASGNNVTLWALQVLVTLAAMAYALRKSDLGMSVASVFHARRAQDRSDVIPGSNRVLWSVLFAGTFVPIVAQTLLIPHGELFTSGRRFWWLWAAEAATIACALSAIRIRGRAVILPAGLAATILFACNPRLKDAAEQAFLPSSTIATTGKHAEDVDEVAYDPVNDAPCRGGCSREAIDELARILKSEGRESARIGYDMNFYPWQMETRLVDGKSKCFAEWDLTLEIRHGIRNSDTSAEGLSVDDEFVIFSPDYGYISRVNPVPAKRWSMTIDGSMSEMKMIARAGRYEIWRRNESKLDSSM
jgi:hypothetical protein